MGAWRQLVGWLLLVLVVFTSGFLGARLGMVSAPVAQASHNFSDVPDNAFYHAFVQFLVDNGITSGCGGGLFCGEEAVTRGQMAVFLKKLSDTVSAKVAARVIHLNPGSVVIPLNIPTTLSWNTADFDTAGLFSAAQPTRLTAPVPGTYMVIANLQSHVSDVVTPAPGLLQLRWSGGSGSGFFATENFVYPANGSFAHTATGLVHLVAGDYVEALVNQSAAGTLGGFSSMSMAWVGP
jgi:hypothetical protein